MTDTMESDYMAQLMSGTLALWCESADAASVLRILDAATNAADAAGNNKTGAMDDCTLVDVLARLADRVDVLKKENARLSECEWFEGFGADVKITFSGPRRILFDLESVAESAAYAMATDSPYRESFESLAASAFRIATADDYPEG